ncbi:MAG: hypothetical protein ACLFPJ_03950 [Candidatus Woesearchaeota archaeon]
MLSIWKCNICKNSFLLNDKPSNCPYCNVISSNIIKADRYYYENFMIEPFEEKIVNDLLNKKINSLSFLKKSFDQISNQIIKNLFLAIIKIEENQLLILKNFLKKDFNLNDAIKDNFLKTKIYEYEEDNTAELYQIQKKYLNFLKDSINLLESDQLVEIFSSFLYSHEDQIKLIEEFI